MPRCEPLKGLAKKQCGGVVGTPEAKQFGALPSAVGVLTRLACARARQAGLDPEPLLAKAGLTARHIEDRASRLAVQSQIKFVELVAAALQDHFLGFHLARDYDLREVGLLHYVFGSSDSLGEALQRLVRYSRIVNDAVVLKLLDGDDVAIQVKYIGVARRSDRHQVEFFMTALLRLCREATTRRLQPTRVKLIHGRDEDTSELNAFMGCEVEFAADRDEIALPPTINETSLIGADRYLNELLTVYCEQALAQRPHAAGPLRLCVENAIVPLLPHGKARLGEIARRLGMSERTLARRLAAEKASFNTVLDELRLDLAKRYVGDLDLSISEVAWLLGYQEVSAFTHAFKRWTGKAPREVRSETQARASA